MGEISGLPGFRSCIVRCGECPPYGAADNFPLVKRVPGFSVVAARSPSPLPPLFSTLFFSFGTSIEAGLELPGVPLGVLLGVEDALSTLAFRKPDLGVTFELKTDFAGVADSSLVFALGVWKASGLRSFARRGERREEEAAARRGAMLRGLPFRVARVGLLVETPLGALFCLSGGMSPFARVAVIVEQAC